MKVRMLRRMIALLMTLLLLCSSAMAEAPFLQHADGWSLAGTPLEVQLSADVISCMPYDDDRLAMLKQVTDVLSLRLQTGENEGSVTVLVGAEDVLTLAYRGQAAQISCIPELNFAAQEDPMGALLGGSTEVSVLPYGLRMDSETLLDDGWILLENLAEPLVPYGNRKSVTTTARALQPPSPIWARPAPVPITPSPARMWRCSRKCCWKIVPRVG